MPARSIDQLLVASHNAQTWDCLLEWVSKVQPRYVPCLGIELTTFQSPDSTPTDWTTPARVHLWFLLNKNCWLAAIVGLFLLTVPTGLNRGINSNTSDKRQEGAEDLRSILDLLFDLRQAEQLLWISVSLTLKWGWFFVVVVLGTITLKMK